jgi:DmsE family decaheme c-type cytochrome
MRRPRVVPMLILGQSAWLAATLAGVVFETTPQAAAPGLFQPAGSSSAAGQDPAQPPYVGSGTCLTCHDDKRRGYEGTAHGQARVSRSPAAQQGCESCHGPGGKHVEALEPGSITSFRTEAPRVANERCLSCHTRGAHAFWEGSTHDARNLSCSTCHSMHDFKSPAALLAKPSEAETCAGCHRAQTTKLRRTSHMPVREGKMSCSSCHNPHGSSNVRLLKVGNWVNESCNSCHADKRGPFLFEHAAGRESCVTCHDPHGSTSERMLVARQPMLCQRCHIGTRHPSTIYDDSSVRARSNRIVSRSCVNCHQTIHGSNHPSGHSFLR